MADNTIWQEAPQLTSEMVDELRQDEYQRWYQQAMKDVAAGQVPSFFLATLIPLSERERIARALQNCTKTSEVQQVFGQKGDVP